ncbi:unnamed protein product, partial [Scytosiphon promiscuus]
MPGYIVAIDLGTSRSAWAFSFQGRAEKEICIRVPEGCIPPASGTKTETAVLLSPGDYNVVAFGRAAREQYIRESQDREDAEGDTGADVGPRPLHAQINRHEGDVEDPGATADGGQNLPLIKVMAAVLRHFKEDAIAYLSSQEETIDGFAQSINWVVTIPAIYDDFSRRFMRMAAHEAGLIDAVDSPRLCLCLEPEAACLAVSVHDAPDLSQPGTKTMILDCGGGTVDITTHEVISLSPLRLKELRPPTGG